MADRIGNIFTDINSSIISAQRVIIDGNNSAPTLQNFSVDIVDVTQLTTSDYSLNVIDNDAIAPLDYQIIRSSDDSSTIVNGVLGTQNIIIDGFSIDIPAATQSNIAIGDTFYIRPTRSGGTDMAIDISRLQELAYALPIVSDAKTGNVGNGSISSGEMLAIVDDSGLAFSPANSLYSSPGVLAAPVLIRFTSPTNYTVLENSDPLNPEALFSGSIIPGQQNSIFDNVSTGPNFIGFQVDIGGNPEAGDEFTIGFNANGTSDNRNALALGGIRLRSILDGNSENFENSRLDLNCIS